jgi:hypothetical protein
MGEREKRPWASKIVPLQVVHSDEDGAYLAEHPRGVLLRKVVRAGALQSGVKDHLAAFWRAALLLQVEVCSRR